MSGPGRPIRPSERPASASPNMKGFLSGDHYKTSGRHARRCLASLGENSGLLAAVSLQALISALHAAEPVPEAHRREPAVMTGATCPGSTSPVLRFISGCSSMSFSRASRKLMFSSSVVTWYLPHTVIFLHKPAPFVVLEQEGLTGADAHSIPHALPACLGGPGLPALQHPVDVHRIASSARQG